MREEQRSPETVFLFQLQERTEKPIDQICTNSRYQSVGVGFMDEEQIQLGTQTLTETTRLNKALEHFNSKIEYLK